MQPRRVEILPSFVAAYDDLDPEIQQRTQEAVIHFSDRSADNALRPELKNGLDNVWGFRVTGRYRAFYKKLRDKDGAIYCLFHVGHHDDYRVLKNLSSRVSISMVTSGSTQIKINFGMAPGASVPQPAEKPLQQNVNRHGRKKKKH